MKKLTVSLENPIAPEFQTMCDNVGATINTLAKAGVLTGIELIFDESREQAVKTALKDSGVVDFTTDNE